MNKRKNNRKSLGVLVAALYIFSFANTAASQISDIDFVIESIRKDYFPLVPESDSVRFEKFVSQKRKEKVSDTLRFLSEITGYFKDQHLICYQRRISALEDMLLPEISVPNIQRRVRVSVLRRDKYAGYWVNDLGTEVIGIFKVNASKNLYHCYVVFSADTARIGSLTLRFSLPIKENPLCEFVNVYFQYRQFAPMHFLSENEFQIWSYTRWKKVSDNYLKRNEPVKNYNYSVSVNKPDSGIVVFRIPENSPENIKIVDSLVLAYKRELETAKLLIIDIRNNPGGTIRTYSKLLPFIYTNEIVRPDGHTYVSKDLLEYEIKNLKSIDSLTDNLSYSTQLKYVDSLRSVLGQRVLYKGKSKIFESISLKPIKVGLLVNYACMSAAEAMVLDLKQSKKVVVFGENTAGAIDNLNTFFMKTPSGKYSMWMPTFRGTPTSTHKHYAGIGIQPDIRIPAQTKDWVQFVIAYFETH
jgi:Peptidase family S41